MLDFIISTQNIDTISVKFAESNLGLLNFCLGFIMFGIALDLKKDDFIQLYRNPKAALAGVIAQYGVFPLITFLMIKIIQPHPSISLGMLLVAVCPSGNISNFITHTAKGNVALAISLTALSTLLAPITTPSIFTFYANLDSGTAELLKNIHLNFFDMLQSVAILLLLPLLLAIFLQYLFPKLVEKIKKSVKLLSLLIFVAFLIMAIKANISIFIKHIHLVVGIVFLQDIFGFLSGYIIGRLFKLNEADCRCLSIETGIHNAGLGLLLIFTFFGGLGGMALITAWWGIWHLIAGMALAYYWSRK